MNVEKAKAKKAKAGPPDGVREARKLENRIWRALGPMAGGPSDQQLAALEAVQSLVALARQAYERRGLSWQALRVGDGEVLTPDLGGEAGGA